MRRAVYKLFFWGEGCLSTGFLFVFWGGGEGVVCLQVVVFGGGGGGGGHCLSTRGHLSTSCFLGWGGGSVCLGLLVFCVLEGVGGLFVYSFFVFQREWDEGVVCLQVCVVVFWGVGVGGGLFVYRLFFVCVFRGRGEGGCLSIGVFVCVCFRERGVGGCLSTDFRGLGGDQLSQR